MDAALLRRFGKAWKEIHALKKKLEEKKDELEPLEKAVVAQMISDGITNINADGQPFWLKRAVHSGIPADAREEVYQFFQSMEDTSSLVQDYIQPSTLSAWVRETFDPDQMLSADEIKAKMPAAIRDKIRVAEVFSIGTRS